MRIQLVLPGLSIGGTEKMVFHLATGLQRKGHAVEVVSLKGREGPLGDVLRRECVQVLPLETPDSWFVGAIDVPRLVWRLRSAFQRFRPEIIQSFLSRANVLTRCAAQSLGIKGLVCSLRVAEAEKRYHLIAERILFPSMSIFTTNSEALKQFAIDKVGLKPERVHVIPNGVEPIRSVEKTEIDEVRKRHGLADEKVILSAGRLHRQKGFDILLTAFQGVVAKESKARLLIAGEGDERERLEQDIVRLGLQARAFLIGPVKDLSAYFRMAHLFVLASRWEGTPNVLLESMMASCPIVSTAVGGIFEILSSPREAWLVSPGDTQSLREAILEALSDADQARRRADNALIKARGFSMVKMVEAYEQLYERVPF